MITRIIKTGFKYLTKLGEMFLRDTFKIPTENNGVTKCECCKTPITETLDRKAYVFSKDRSSVQYLICGECAYANVEDDSEDKQ